VAILLDAPAIDPRSELITEGRRGSSLAQQRVSGYVASDDRFETPLVFSIARAHKLAPFLLQPAASLPGEREPDQLVTGAIDTPTGPVPVGYAFETRLSSVRRTGYFMTHRGAPVESPFLARTLSGPRALVEGRYPITLFVASTSSHESQRARARERIDDWLRAAWVHYNEVCSP
jgi:hypothetical protein